MGETAYATATFITPSIDYHHPLFLYPSDAPGSLSIGIMLTGSENYTLWSRAVELALLGRNKMGFIDGRVSRRLVQGLSSVSVYYSKLKVLWDEYDLIMPPPSYDCPKSREFSDHLQYQRVLQFLMGLNDSYSQARS